MGDSFLVPLRDGAQVNGGGTRALRPSRSLRAHLRFRDGVFRTAEQLPHQIGFALFSLVLGEGFQGALAYFEGPVLIRNE